MSTITGTLTVSGTTVTGTLTVDETVVNGTLGVITGGGGAGVPVGGTTAQSLVKASNADYDTVWATPAGGGDALVANPLSQFAATTKAQLNGVISDGTPMYVGDAPAAHTHVVANVTDFDAGVSANAAVAANTAKVSNVDHPLVETAVPVGAVFTDTVYNDAAIQAEVDLNTAKVGVTTEIKPTDIDTLDELNAIVTDATLIDTTDARLSDARTPTAHTHVASEITDFDAEVSNNAAVAANTAKVGVTVEEQNPDLISQAEAEAGTATTERTFSALRVAQAIAALGGGGGGGALVAYKPANESKTNDNTFAADTDLQIALEASSFYAVDVFIVHLTDAAPELRTRFDIPAGASGYKIEDWDNSNANNSLWPAYKALLGAPFERLFTVRGYVKTTTAGTFAFSWAQNSSNPAAVTIKEGSWIIATKLN